jgi:uncharacterized protein YodC (DUF2158 family)
MSDGIEAGRIVQLKSGGPKMTVSKVLQWNGAMRARREWFKGDKNLSDMFELPLLKVVEATEMPLAVRVVKPGFRP